MANMRILIRIVFVIFIANRIDCLGGGCDNCCNCCDCFKDITAEFLVNNNWYNSKDNLVLKIFVKDNGIFTSKDNKYKISIEFDEKGNPKIAYQNKKEDELNLRDKKYAFFEIKTNTNKTVYLYCSDVKTSKSFYGFVGIFEKTTHVSISVIACDTEEVTSMAWMFSGCSSLKELDLNNFDTKNVTDMNNMFWECSSLENLNLNNFNTTNVTNMEGMFCNCSNLTDLKFGDNFNTTKVTYKWRMFYGCDNLSRWN